MAYLSALCSKLTPIYDNSGILTGYPIVQVVEEVDEFTITPDYVWVPFTAAIYPDVELEGGYVATDETTLVYPRPVYYSTVNSLVYNQTTYSISQQVVMAPGLAVSDVTLTPPPLSPEGTLYYYLDAWVASFVDPTLSLADAKSTLISQVSTLASIAVNNQLVESSQVSQITSPDVLGLATLSYSSVTIGTYQNYVSGVESVGVNTINAAATVADLYDFDPASLLYSPAPDTVAIYYSLADGTIYEGVTYNQGDALMISSDPPLPTPPTGFTDVQPIGGSSAYDYPQWNGTTWVQAPFPIAYTLAQAQVFLTSLVNANASVLVSNQLRNYSVPQLFAAADVDTLLPADSVSNLYPTVGDYQTAVDAEIAAQLAFIAAATAVNQLYTFDPTVTAPPNYVP